MFFLLRAILVIGAIFYFSPLRNDSGVAGPAIAFERLLGKPFLKESVAAQDLEADNASPARLEAVWNALPESARQALLDKILPSPPATRVAVPSGAPRTDTLLPEDHAPAWTGVPRKPGA